MPEHTVIMEIQGGTRQLAPQILQMFEDDQDLYEPLFYDGGHPDEPGYTLFAQTVAAWVKERRWVK